MEESLISTSARVTCQVPRSDCHMSQLDPMPRATTEKFRRVHQPAPKQKEASTSGSVTNPIFNTARFGQHILKNSQTCQRCGCIFFIKVDH